MGVGDDKIVLVIVLLIGLVAVVAVVLSAVALGKQSITPVTVNSGGGGDKTTGNAPASAPPPKKTYTLHIGHDYGAHEYFDKKGYIQGFTPDMVKLVCTAAGVDCRTIWDKYSNCWESQAGKHASGGEGLLGRWYDGCMGWYKTVDRIHVYSFSEPYASAPVSYFFVKKDDNKFNAKNIQKKKIGFIEGWASDEKCLARATNVIGSFLPAGSVMHYPDATALQDAIVAGKVDAGFASVETVERFTGSSGTLKQLPESVSCMLAGNSMMARKDSDFIKIWNEGFGKVVSNGDFRDLCAKGKDDHGSRGSISCIGN